MDSCFIQYFRFHSQSQPQLCVLGTSYWAYQYFQLSFKWRVMRSEQPFSVFQNPWLSGSIESPLDWSDYQLWTIVGPSHESCFHAKRHGCPIGSASPLLHAGVFLSSRVAIHVPWIFLISMQYLVKGILEGPSSFKNLQKNYYTKWVLV